MNEEKRKISGKMIVSKSFSIYVGHVINDDFKEGDLERGYTEVVTRTIGSYVYYKRPPKDMMIMAIVKKRNMKFLKEEYKEIIPDLVYFV